MRSQPVIDARPRFVKALFLAMILSAVSVMATGCSSLGLGDQQEDSVHTISIEVAGDQIEVELESPSDEQYLQAGKEFLEAIIRKDSDAAYALLSTHARARMSRNQFYVPADDAIAMKNERTPLTDITPASWVGLVEAGLQRHGQPDGVMSYWVQSTDTETLSGRGDPLDVMISIGSMPESVPTDIRRAALRASVVTEMTDAEAEEIAAEVDLTPEEVMADESFARYFNLKFVLVEEEAELKVGYFEFLPPSILD